MMGMFPCMTTPALKATLATCSQHRMSTSSNCSNTMRANQMLCTSLFRSRLREQSNVTVVVGLGLLRGQSNVTVVVVQVGAAGPEQYDGGGGLGPAAELRRRRHGAGLLRRRLHLRPRAL